MGGKKIPNVHLYLIILNHINQEEKQDFNQTGDLQVETFTNLFNLQTRANDYRKGVK